jgi:hypothetical protein
MVRGHMIQAYRRLSVLKLAILGIEVPTPMLGVFEHGGLSQLTIVSVFKDDANTTCSLCQYFNDTSIKITKAILPERLISHCTGSE